MRLLACGSRDLVNLVDFFSARLRLAEFYKSLSLFSFSPSAKELRSNREHLLFFFSLVNKSFKSCKLLFAVGEKLFRFIRFLPEGQGV